MKRRAFLAVTGGVAAAWAFPSMAQPLPTIGFLSSQSAESFAPYAAAFRRGLEEAGFADGRNVRIEYRWAGGHLDRLPELAADLLRRRVTVIAATGGVPTVVAAKAATTTVPIVFNSGQDPVEAGLVKSLRQPGGNLTGVSWFSADLAGKRVQLLLELVPAARLIGLLFDPASPESMTQPKPAELAVTAGGRRLIAVQASTPDQIDAAFKMLGEQHVDALVVGAGAIFYNRREQIIALAAQYSMPAIYLDPQQAADGGLISYGNDLADAYRRNAHYVGRILKGDNPGDLPIDRSTKFTLVINLKTAKALGLSLPQSLLARADEVIE